MPWGIVIAFIAGCYCGMVVMALLTMSKRQDEWHDSL
jgi:ABC-type multidrug transport system permease subunit